MPRVLIHVFNPGTLESEGVDLIKTSLVYISKKIGQLRLLRPCLRKNNVCGLESWSVAKILAALADPPGSIPSIHMRVHNHFNSSPRDLTL